MATGIVLAAMFIADSLDKEKPGLVGGVFKGIFGLFALGFTIFYDVSTLTVSGLALF